MESRNRNGADLKKVTGNDIKGGTKDDSEGRNREPSKRASSKLVQRNLEAGRRCQIIFF